jgi:enamine deaminase RidA (YjgF/YER057c/UK114 family)
MSAHISILPEGWKRPSGYSNGVLATGQLLFIAGQVGWNPRTSQFETDDFTAQFGQALDNVLAVLTASRGRTEHLARLTVYVTDKKRYLADLPGIGAAWKARMGNHYPAMALLEVADLVEDRALVEIEATAVIP